MDDAAFVYFIGLQLLRSQRDTILRSDSADMPEIVSRGIQVEAFLDAPENILEALKAFHATPRCLLRLLRLCCVSSCELTPLPPVANLAGTGPGGRQARSAAMWGALDGTLAAQSVRRVVMMSAQELVKARITHYPIP